MVSIYSGSAIATIYATITDDLSGVMHDGSPCGDICYPTGIGIYSPSGNKYGFGFVHHVSGDLYKVRFSFSKYAETGIWNVRHVQLTDNAGNMTELWASDLEAAGLQASVDVTNNPPTEHAMTVSLSLSRHLIASGVASPEDASPACAISAVLIARRTATGSWRPVSSVITSETGTFRVKLPDQTGRYKAIVNAATKESGTDRCLAAESSVVRHRHG